MDYYSQELESLEKSLKGNSFNSNSLHLIKSVINSESIILITDINGVIININDKCCSMLGYQPDELIGQHTRIFKTGHHSTEFYHHLWTTILAGEIWKGEMHVKRKDGSFAWHSMSIFPLLDENNHPYQFLTLRTDITEQKEMEVRALQIERQFHSLFEITHEAIGCINPQGTIMYANPAFERLIGTKLTDKKNQNIFDYMDKEDVPKRRQALEELIKEPGSSISREVKLRRKDHSQISCEVILKNYLHDPHIKGIVFTYRDITEQKKNLQKVQRWENFDALTGLPNQRNCINRLMKELDDTNKNDISFAILLFDIDDFKYINDTFGHDTGNKLLKELSLRLQSEFDNNLYISRQGGDEFILLLQNTDDFEDIHNTAKKLITLVHNKPFKIEENEFFVTVSIGISVFPFSGETVGNLLKNAELAMYRAKDSGKNQYQIFSSTMNLSSYKQFTLRNDSKKALLHNEFCIYYQPRMNPVTNTILSAEALIRWRHPNWGMVSPDEFIPMAEESGLIIPMGEWLIRKVCTQIKKWEEEQVGLKKISINLSSLQLLQPNFTDIVSTILTETGVDSKWIEFEITESVLIEKEEQVLKTMAELENLGITFALDDFGTGYSSLNYLRKLPCDTVKIDKSLIEEIHNDSQDYEIVASIIRLCKKLKKSVVAEGVEKKSQLSLLKKLGCDEIQGYYYSKPLNVQEFSSFLRDGKWKKTQLNQVSKVNKRKYFRISLKVPLVADMTIEGIGNKKINIGSTEVLITDIGPGGLCFHSTLKLPVKEDITLRFTTDLFSKNLQLNGHIVRHTEIAANDQQYGVEFHLDDTTRDSLIKVLNNLQVKLRHHSILPNCRFYIKENI